MSFNTISSFNTYAKENIYPTLFTGTTLGCLGAPVNPGPSNGSGLCSGTDAAVAYRTDRQTFKLTGCQFIGHHLVPHHGPSSVKVHNLGKPTQENKDARRSEEGSLHVVFDGSLRATALPVEHAQLPHGVAVTPSEHQKARQPQCW